MTMRGTDLVVITKLTLGYAQAKNRVGGQLGASEALLRVNAGLAVFVAAALLLLRRMDSRVALALAAMLAISNEVVDYLGPAPSTYSQNGGRHVQYIALADGTFLLSMAVIRLGTLASASTRLDFVGSVESYRFRPTCCSLSPVSSTIQNG